MILYGKIDFRNQTNLLCALHSFFTIFFSHLSSNVLAVTNVIRCIDIISLNMKNPTNFGTNSRKNFEKQLLFRMGKIEVILLAVICLLFLFNSHFIIFMRLTDDATDMSEENFIKVNHTVLTCFPSRTNQKLYYEFYTKIWPTIDLFLYSYIPFIVMISSTIVIMRKLCKANNSLNKTKQTSINKDIELSDMNSLDDCLDESIQKKGLPKCQKAFEKESKKRSNRNNQIYRLLIALNVAFFVMVTPLVLCNSLKIVEIENHNFFDIVYILAYLNHCLNFIFYGMTCELYRNALKALIFKPRNAF